MSFDLPTLLKLLSGHQWMPLAIVVLLYVRTLLSDTSRFPITIPSQWLPTVSAALGGAYAVLVSVQSGTAVGQALLNAVMAAGSAGFADGLLMAIFGDPSKAPSWARFLVVIADDLTGKGGGSPAGKPAAVPPPSKPTPPPTAARGRLISGVFAMLVVASIASTDCKALPTIENVAQVILSDFQAGKSQAQIESDACSALGGSSLEDVACKDVSALVVDIIEAAIGKGQLAGDALDRAKAYRLTHAKAAK